MLPTDYEEIVRDIMEDTNFDCLVVPNTDEVLVVCFARYVIRNFALLYSIFRKILKTWILKVG